jgi:hypothetical protein
MLGKLSGRGPTGSRSFCYYELEGRASSTWYTSPHPGMVRPSALLTYSLEAGVT